MNLPFASSHSLCLIRLQEEDEVPDDETVNQMIARSEEEFEQFMVSRAFISFFSFLVWVH